MYSIMLISLIIMIVIKHVYLKKMKIAVTVLKIKCVFTDLYNFTPTYTHIDLNKA